VNGLCGRRWLWGTRRWCEEQEFGSVNGEDFGMEDGDGYDGGDERALGGEGRDGRPAVVGAEDVGGFNERLLKHGGTSK